MHSSINTSGWHDFMMFFIKPHMKVLAAILILTGILMFVFGNVTFTHKEKVLEAGPVEINKKEKKTIAWPNYAGGIAIATGVIVLIASANKKN
jgi:hypothetical protein